MKYKMTYKQIVKELFKIKPKPRLLKVYNSRNLLKQMKYYSSEANGSVLSELYTKYDLEITNKYIAWDSNKLDDASKLPISIIDEYYSDASRIWDKHGLFSDDDVDYNGSYLLEIIDLLIVLSKHIS